MEKSIKVEIKPKTILLIVGLIIGIWMFTKLLSVVFLVFIAFSISALLSPVIDYLHSKRIPKNISMIVIYVLFFTALTFFIILIFDPMVQQFKGFGDKLPELITISITGIVERFPWLQERFNWDVILDDLQNSFLHSSGVTDFITNIPKHIFSIIGSFFTVIVSIFTVIVLSILFIQRKEFSKQKFIKLLPKNKREKFLELFKNIEGQVAAWLRGQIILMLIIGVLSWLGPVIIGVEFSIPLGIIGGILEVIPSIGPLITFLLALIVTAGAGAPLWKVIFMAVWFILIQQFENSVIVPKIMHKVVGLDPLITLITLLAMTQLLGAMGAIIAIPLVAIVQITIKYFLNQKKDSD